jgi:hemerythrin-like domain-containing protein
MAQPAIRQIDPIAMFIQEHEDVLLHLRTLNKIAASIKEKGIDDELLKTLDESMQFIKEEVEVHNRREEEALFPVVERYVDGPTRSLKDDHRHLARHFETLQEAAHAITLNKDDQEAIQQFLLVARTIVQIMVNHIHKENHILFPMLQRFLTKDELREVTRKML